jgi:hypothetical protein
MDDLMDRAGDRRSRDLPRAANAADGNEDSGDFVYTAAAKSAPL